ncbi:MAG TPA: class I SAM-dependent methyltransferase [Solirubrobacteraceae bacterium]|nr:class I SAM-dependent methyltransferase [Solirubrobacteraceae bacterium]
MPGRLYEASWGRLFALGYDRFMAASERAGLRARRRALLARADGATLEIGAGTGLNLGLYPPALSELVLTEPSPHMAARLRAKLGAGPGIRVVEATAERLPFEADRFDTVVATLVLCTVPDPAAAVREIARVLRPEGRLLFLEHVRAPEPRLARWQDRLERPWRVFGAGCHCNRDTAARIEASALRIEDLDRGEIPRAVPIVRPLIVGAARPAA